MTETWRTVPGYETYYEVSTLGRVRSLTRNSGYRNRVHKGRALNPSLNCNGYRTATLCKPPGHREHWFVHELVLTAFVGPRPCGQVTRHKDGDRTNNRLTNLAWGTYTENSADAISHGTHERGSMRRQAILTETDVADMRAAARSGVSIKKLAATYGVAYRTAAHVISGTKWKHVLAPTQSRPIVYLTDDQVRLVRQLLSDGLSLSEVGRRVRRPPNSIKQIRDGKAYKWVA